ncbi:hypothetical protein VN12_22860 [Pirellula sp. SH-Sr6A]|nr:hypothetical protein VN12_22860 [Pirellula sp. SH-Sr6A]
MFLAERQIGPTRRKFLLWVMAALYTFASLPLPFCTTQQSFESATDPTPYPCQGGACGCRDAKTCWTNCCCRTPEERSEWAAENGIEPPIYAIVANWEEHGKDRLLVRTVQIDASATSCPPRKRSCCSGATEKDSYCGSDASCGDSVRSCCKAKPNQNRKALSKQSRWIVFMEAAKCRGLSFDVTKLSVSDISIPFALIEDASGFERQLPRMQSLAEVHMDVPHPPPRSNVA